MRRLDFVTRANADYVDEQYRRYLAEPAPLDDHWALFFAGFELAANGHGANATASAASRTATAPAPSTSPAEPVIGVFDLVHSYRELGHLVAHLNPLEPPPEGHPLLEASEFG